MVSDFPNSTYLPTPKLDIIYGCPLSLKDGTIFIIIQFENPAFFACRLEGNKTEYPSVLLCTES